MATALSKSAVKSHPRSPTTAQPPPAPNPGSSSAMAGGGAVLPPPSSAAAGSALSKNAAMAELKSRVLAALAKLSDHDTHHITVEELDRIICAPPMRLVATLCASHPDATAPHLHKVLAHLARRFKDLASDTSGAG